VTPSVITVGLLLIGYLKPDWRNGIYLQNIISH